MPKPPSAKINYLYSIAFQILSIATPLVTAPYLARVIGASGVGVFSYTSSIALYFSMFGMLGLNSYGNRCIAKVRDDRDKLSQMFSSLFYLQILTCALVSIAYLAYLFLLVKSNFTISAMHCLTVFSSMINLIWLYMGLEDFRVIISRSAVIKLLALVSIFVFVKTREDLWKYTLIISLGNFLGNVPFIVLMRKHVCLVKVGWRDILNHLKPNVILLIPILSVSIYRTLDKLMLGWMSSYEEVGYFENADKVINICLGFIAALGQVMLPKSANLVAKGKFKENNDLITRSFLFSTLLSSAMAFGVIGIARVFVPVFFGEEFLPTTGILILLAPNLFFLAWGNVLKTQYLVPQEMDWTYLNATLLGAVINIAINLVLIPQLKGIGASIGTVAAEMVSVGYIAYRVRGKLNLGRLIGKSTGYIGIGAVMMAAIWAISKLLDTSVWSIVILVLTGILVFSLGGQVLYRIAGDSLLQEIYNAGMSLFRGLWKRSKRLIRRSVGG